MKLRELHEKDAGGMLEWMHDSSINCFFRFDADTMTYERVQNFIRESNNEENRKNNLHYAISGDNDEYLGTISLKNIDVGVKSAEYAISMRKAAHGKGIGSAATREILRIAFEEYNLNRVYLNVLSDNVAAIKMYEKNGFRFEGRFIDHILVHGELKSLSWYAILKEEYNKIYKK